MEMCGIPFEICVLDTDEFCQGMPQERVMELAKRKALAVQALLPDRAILAADTLVYAKNQVLGKPTNEAHAIQMLKILSGETHHVFTGVCLLDATTGTEIIRYDQTSVRFSTMDDETIRQYVLTGEPMDKAGAYALQGRATMFVENIDGSYSNVIGLPMALVRQMLKQLPNYAML